MQEAEKLADEILKVQEAIEELGEDSKQIIEIKKRLLKRREHATVLLSAG